MSGADRSADQPVMRAHGPSPEDWVEVLTNPTTGPVTGGRFYGVGRNASYTGCETGDIPAFRVGGQWRVPTEPLLQRIGLVTLEAREAALRRAQEAIAARASRRRDAAAPQFTAAQAA